MMAEVETTESVTGPLSNSATKPAPVAADKAAPGSTEAALAPSSARAFLEVAAAAVATAHPVFGAEVVYANGRYKELSSPRFARCSREDSAERNQAAVNTPCGIMKVGSLHFLLSRRAKLRHIQPVDTNALCFRIILDAPSPKLN